MRRLATCWKKVRYDRKKSDEVKERLTVKAATASSLVLHYVEVG